MSSKIEQLPPKDDLTLLSQLLKASGDALRLEVLRALAQDSFGVLELCKLFDTKQSGMSHHLKVMAKAGLVNTRKEGNSIYYRRAPLHSDEPFVSVKRAIFENIDQVSLSPSVDKNLQDIYAQRAEASRGFFSENVERFKKQQDLIASFDVYGSHVADMLENSSLASREVALEVGPGTGEFLHTLAQHFTHITALDNSEEMLAEAKKRCQQLDIVNIDFVHRDTSHCITLNDSVDCAVINMVLHHTPSPQQIFSDVSQALKSEGIMIICDLCQHNQDWTRETCGDLWLGFAPEDLNNWAALYRLREGQSSYFALRNGFQIQIREFIKQ